MREQRGNGVPLVPRRPDDRDVVEVRPKGGNQGGRVEGTIRAFGNEEDGRRCGFSGALRDSSQPTCHLGCGYTLPKIGRSAFGGTQRRDLMMLDDRAVPVRPRFTAWVEEPGRGFTSVVDLRQKRSERRRSRLHRAQVDDASRAVFVTL
jgi:hypothetical protein